MMCASPPELEYAYAVAGLRVLTNRPVENPDIFSSTDDTVHVVFTLNEVNLSEVDHHLLNAEFSGVWYRLPQSDSVPVYFRGDGRVVMIQEPDAIIFDYTAQLRRVIPFAAALQKKLVLHASAVSKNQGVVSFIGPSRAGKTALAERLSEMGFTLVADDLLPCRTSCHNAVIPMADSSSNSPLELPLTRIYFLIRDESLERVVINVISRLDCFLELLRHGFGELPVAEAWKTQFVSYHKIAKQVPAYRLQIAVGARYLDEAATLIAKDNIR